LDLTTNETPKTLSPKRWIPYAVVALALLAILVFVLIRGFRQDNGAPGYSEDQLPAIKVVVLNGCGYEQLASEFAAAISHKNIEVVSLGDTPKPIYDKSVIVVRKGDMQDLARLQKMTGIERWTSALNEFHNADFDIIVGRDYELYIK